MPEFIRGEVAFWFVGFAVLGGIIGNAVKGSTGTVGITPSFLLLYGVGLFVGFVVIRFLRGRIGPYWWIPYFVCAISAVVFYVV